MWMLGQIAPKFQQWPFSLKLFPLNKFICCLIRWSHNTTQTTTVSNNISVPNQAVSASKHSNSSNADAEKEVEGPGDNFSITIWQYLWQYFSEIWCKPIPRLPLNPKLSGIFQDLTERIPTPENLKRLKVNFENKQVWKKCHMDAEVMMISNCRCCKI